MMNFEMRIMEEAERRVDEKEREAGSLSKPKELKNQDIEEEAENIIDRLLELTKDENYND